MSSIDTNLVAKRYKNIARAFVCEKCHKVSLNPLQCANKICGKITCKECVVNSNEACISCYGVLSPIIKNMELILGLIKFKCSKACTALFEGKEYIQHINSCRPKPKEQVITKPVVPDLEDYYLLMNKQKRSEDEDEFEDESYSDSSIADEKTFVSSLKTADLMNDKVLKKLKASDLECLDKTQLKVIVESRGLPVSGNKEELIARIITYKSLAKTKIKKFTDKKLEKMIINNTIKDLKNEELEDILMARDLKKGGNKDEKTQTLLKYLLSKK